MGGTGPRYPNGRIPAKELVLIEGNHWATRGTAARWNALKADVQAREGITLRITGGENAYRSFSGQQFARRNACARGRCNDAAVPGYSSHGGSLNGRDSGAIDVDNWALLGKTKFYAYAREHGFEPGYFDWEPWHIIDWAPYTVPSGGGASKPAPVPAPQPTSNAQSEEDEVAYATFAVRDHPRKGTTLVRTHSLDTGEEDEFESTNDEKGDSYNRNVALSYGCSPLVPVSYISKSHYDKIGRSNAERRARLAPRS